MTLTFRNIVIVVLAISFVTFIVLFGRVPALRNTPIGHLYRLLWVHLPHLFRSLDQRITRGRLTVWASRAIHYLTEEKHPIVLFIFVSLLFFSECAFIPTAYPHLSNTQLFVLVPLISLPYSFIYRCWTAKSHLIHNSNHAAHMLHYPYDHILFHPGRICRTCKLLKPARSKHCSICKTCVAKNDHHCIWINNCVGRGNYQYFVLMLLFTGILLSYGAYLGYSILSNILQTSISPPLPGQHWSAGKTWTVYFQLWGWVIVHHVCIGFVGLLALLCSPLAWGLLGYHSYLIWAGMTTNESVKWSDLSEDIFDGLVFIGERENKSISNYTHGAAASITTPTAGSVSDWNGESEDDHEVSEEEAEPVVQWPVSTNQVVVRTDDGEPPPLWSSKKGRVRDWRRMRSLQEIENIYDLGYWDNFLDIFAGDVTD